MAGVLGSAAAAAAFAIPAQGAQPAAAAAWPICDYRPTPPGASAAAGSAIDERYAASARLRQILGAPTGPEKDAANTSRTRPYLNGDMYLRAASGVGPREVNGQIDYLFSRNNYLETVGVPLTDECPTAAGGGRYNHFGTTAGDAEASIYWNQNGPVGVDDVGTPAGEEGVHDHWEAANWENGIYGWPTSSTADTSVTAPTHGRFSNFGGRNGFPTSIYWSKETGAHGILGLIRQRWVDKGREMSYLGFPTSDEFATPTGRRSNFQHGCITFDSRTGVVTDSAQCS